MVTIPLLASHLVYHLPPSYHWATDHFPIISWLPSHCWHLTQCTTSHYCHHPITRPLTISTQYHHGYHPTVGISPCVPPATILPLGHWPFSNTIMVTTPLLASHPVYHLPPSHISYHWLLPLPNNIMVTISQCWHLTQCSTSNHCHQAITGPLTTSQ